MAYTFESPMLSAVEGPLVEVECDLLVVSCPQEGGLSEAANEVDRETGGLLQRLLDLGSFKGRAFAQEWVYPSPTKAQRVLMLGAGKADQYNVMTLRRLAAVAVRQARNKKAARVCIALATPQGLSEEEAASVVADGVVSGIADSDLYKDTSKKQVIREVLVWSKAEHAAAALERGRLIGESVNFARWLGDEPANIMTPTRVAEEVAARARQLDVDCEILDEDAIASGGMNSLLSVSRGSVEPPRVLVLRYNGGGNAPLLAFVGKGVTFDTGGISIKPAADMHYMKYDMCGSAAAVSALAALAALKSKVNVMAVVGLVENMPSAHATRPGDVVRAASGKSIEIINTDAEGRLVLADALDLARKRGAQRLVDLATLTGAIKVALGTAATGAMGKPQSWVGEVLKAADDAGERIWQMPLFPEYLDQLKSNIADVMNSGGRLAGALTAGMFLQQFVGDTPWVHLDIAGTAWTEKDSLWQMKGATGAMIRTLIKLAESAS